MPKTKFQGFIFTLIMVFCMVYCMTAYNVALMMGGLSYTVFGIALKEMWIEYVIVFLLAFFLITENSKRLTFKTLNPSKSQPIMITLMIQSFTVCQMVPTITLITTFIHNGFNVNWFTQWITSAVLCFPMAFCLQIFFVGPFVRFIFGLIFNRESSKAIPSINASEAA